MNGTLAIFKKEFKGFIFAPTFWVICFLLSIIFSWTYPLQLKMFTQLLANYVMQQGISANQLNIHFGVFLRQIGTLNLFLIFVVPAFTMKLFSEEKKMRTFDLLLTSPVTSLQIVLGKFFAALCAVLGVILVGFFYPLATSLLVKINWAPLFTSFLGVVLLGAAYVAMDLFCSSLTENSLIAYVASVVLNISIWYIGMGVEIVDSEIGRKIFEHISLISHLSGLMEGTIRTSGLIFILSLITLFCFLVERVVESSRWR